MLKKGNNIFSLLVIVLSIFMTSSVNIVNVAASPTPETTAVTNPTNSDQTTDTTPTTAKDWGSQLITKVQLQNSEGKTQDSFDPYDTIRAYWEFATPKGGVNENDTITVKVPDQLVITGNVTAPQPVTEIPGGKQIGTATLNKTDRTVTVTFNSYAANKSKTDTVTGSFYVSTSWNLNLVQEHQKVPIDWNVNGAATSNTDSTGSASVGQAAVTDPNEILYKYGSYVENGDIIQWTVRVNYKGEEIKDAVYNDTLGKNQTLLNDTDHPITVNSATADHATGNITNDADNKFAGVKATTTNDGFTINLGDINQTAIITYYTKIDNLDDKSSSYSNTGDLLSNKDELQNITINQPNTTLGSDAHDGDQVTSIMGHKIWNVPAGTEMPNSVTINLIQNGNAATPLASKTVTADTNWSYVFNNLPKYDDNGNAYNYTVQETPVTGFTSVPDPTNYNITNVLSKFKVTKVWNDGNDKYNQRPKSVIVGVYGDGTPDPNYVSLSEKNNWTHTWDNLPSDANWTVSEIGYNQTGYDYNDPDTVWWTQPKNYIATQTINNGNNFDKTITNTLATTFKVTKNWVDGNNTSSRPDEVKVELYANNVDTGQSATLNADNGWSYTFGSKNDLPKFDTKTSKEITYSAKETTNMNDYGYTVDNGEPNSDDSEQIITNTKTTHLTVNKVWKDDKTTHDPITVRLLADGVDTGKALTLYDDNKWTDTFKDLAVQKDGKDIVYTVSENTPDGYTSSVEQPKANETTATITNTPDTPKTRSFKVVKEWRGDSETDRPNSIKVYLTTNGVKQDTPVTISPDASGNWTYTWNNLAINDKDGNPITYSVEEDPLDNYVTNYGDSKDGTADAVIYNTLKPTTPPVDKATHLTVNKVWNDDKTTHDPITVRLLADGVDTGKTLTLSDDNKWTDTFTDLAVQKDGKDITYTVSEDTPAGYTSSVEQPKANETTATITNTPKDTTPTPTDTRSFKVVKEWRGDSEADRPSSIKVYLTVNGVKQATPVTISKDADGNWTHTWNDLAINDKDGNPITYSVQEDSVDKYVTNYGDSKDGTADAVIYNTLKPTTPPDTAKTSMTVTKQWNDDNDKDKLRAKSVEIQLLADGKAQGPAVTLSDANKWTYTWNNLDKQSNNQDITYSVSEKTVTGYTSENLQTDSTHITVINTHTPKTTTPTDSTRSFQVKKYWNDENDKDGLRPTEIKVQLTANGQNSGEPITLNAKNGWTYTWNDLAKQSNGSEIKYNIKEIKVTGYTTNIDLVDGGANITNVHVPKTTVPTDDKTYLAVTKVWNDENDRDKLRPNQVSVQLLTNGKATGDAVVLNQNNNWSYKWDNLNKANSYSVVETPVTGYTTSIKTVDDNNLVLTNTHQPKNPGTPSKPGKPENPSIPVTPTTPSTPDTPNQPDNPNVPTQPSTPDNPLIPNTPATPDTPKDPTLLLPDNPLNPATPSQPDHVTKKDPTGSLLPQTGSKEAAWIYSLIGLFILSIVGYLIKKIA